MKNIVFTRSIKKSHVVFCLFIISSLMVSCVHTNFSDNYSVTEGEIRTTGCSGDDVPGQKFVADVEELLGEIVPEFDNDIEESIVLRQTAEYLFYVKQYKGENLWNRFLQDAHNTNDIAKSLISVYGMTMYQMNGYIVRKLLTYMPKQPDSELTSLDIGEFRIFYEPAGPVSVDMESVLYILKLYHQELSGELLRTQELNNRYYSNIANLQDNTIQVFLLTNKEMIEAQFGDVRGMAAALIGYLYTDEDQFELNARILSKYYGFFVTYALAHEITHLIWAFSYIDPQFTRMLPEPLNEDEQREFSDMYSIFSDSAPLKEGVAEYMNARCNLLAKYGIISDVHNQLRYYFQTTGETFSLKDLAERIYDPRDDAPTYEIAHSLFAFLVEKYGFDAALQLTYSMQTDDDFRRVLGVGLDGIDMAWKEFIGLAGG